MPSKIYSIDIKPDYIIDVTFFNGHVKRFDFKEQEKIPFNSYSFDGQQFPRVSIDKSKMHLEWENGTKIDNSKLWYEGVLLEIVDIEDAAIRFADRMRVLRESVWMTQKELEEKTGIYQADISKIERGEANPSVSTMQRIVRGMGYDLQFFAAEYKDNEGFTVADILEREEDEWAELIDGVIYDMSAPVFIHQEILSFINVEIANYIRKNKGKCKVVQAPTGVMFENDVRNYLLPDLLVVCDQSKIKRQGVVGGPDFVLEIVSESTAEHDYHYKVAKYAKTGVREYWIIDPYKKCLVKYHFEKEAAPEVHFFDEQVEISIFGGELSIDLNEIGRIVEADYEDM